MHGKVGIKCLLPQLCDTILQPVTGAPRRLVFRVQLVYEINIANGIGNSTRKLWRWRRVLDVENIGSSNRLTSRFSASFRSAAKCFAAASSATAEADTNHCDTLSRETQCSYQLHHGGTIIRHEHGIIGQIKLVYDRTCNRV